MQTADRKPVTRKQTRTSVAIETPRASSETTARSTRISTYDVSIAESVLVRVFFYSALTLIAVHGTLAYIHYEIRDLPWLFLQLFDMDEENNLPTWFSGALLLVTAGTLWMCTLKKRREYDRWQRHWTVLASGFLFLAIDEIAGLHETFNSSIEMSWAIPGGIAAVLVGIFFIPFLLNLPRPIALRFLLAGAIYVGGAVGMELVGAPMESDSLIYYMETMVEEGMEMLGVIYFLYTLLAYMRAGDERSIRLQMDIS